MPPHQLEHLIEVGIQGQAAANLQCTLAIRDAITSYAQLLLGDLQLPGTLNLDFITGRDIAAPFRTAINGIPCRGTDRQRCYLADTVPGDLGLAITQEVFANGGLFVTEDIVEKFAWGG